jgi:O-antigen ligase
MLSARQLGVMATVGPLIVALGWFIPSAVGQSISTVEFWMALVSLVVPMLLLMVIRPVFAGIWVVGFAFVNPGLLPPAMELGELSIRYVDVAFGVLIFVVWVRMGLQRRMKAAVEFRELFAPLLPFLLYIGLSLAVVHITVPYFYKASLASYLRLIITASFAFVLHLGLKERPDIEILHGGTIILSLIAVVIGGWQAWSGFESVELGTSTARFGGLLSINALGLVSGLLILYAFLRRDINSRSVCWVIPLASGLFGLFLSKSSSSILATAGAVSIYMAAMRPRGHKGVHFFKWVAIGTTVGTVAALAILTWRSHEVSELFNLSGGSFAHRLMIANAGLRIFLQHPLVGVGWQASATEMVIGSPTLNMALMQRFLELPVQYFFSEKPTSLHNMYIQLLAELGIIGFALFVYGCFRTGKALMKMVGSISAESPYRAWARFYTLGLVFLLIWWNTNPLFGGQTESILAFTFLAALASVAQLEKREARDTIRSKRSIG